MSRIAVKDEAESAVPLRQKRATLSVETDGAGFVDISAAVRDWLVRHRAGDGLCALFIRHTSASLVIQENADPNVRRDLALALDRLAPEDAGWLHVEEGADDMPAHVKAALTDTALTIPVAGGRLPLGTWQAIYLVEHRRRPHRREILLHYLGS